MGCMTEEKHYSIVEMEELVAGLSDADIARFIQYFEARGCVRRVGWSGVEHFYHTVADVLEGKRTWPKGVHPTAFLWNAGRSILSNEASKKRHETDAQHMDVDEFIEKGQSQDGVADSHDESSYIENALETQEGQKMVQIWFSQVKDLFADEDSILCILQQKYNDLKKNLILKVCDLDEKGYQAAVAKMKYRLKKAFPGGLPWWEIES